MSKTIDERVLSMQFDNKQFENNVRTSLSTIDRLKQSLNFKGVGKGLENLNTSIKKVDVSPLGGAVQSIGLKFNGMYSMADQYLRNLENRVEQAARNIVSAFTIQPIKTGFQEYETQINAIQTILSNTESKGTTLDDVNRALDELNKYSDKTIYNFTEMTRNIGTFTAAGTDLDTSVNAIQGIANLAAISGSTSQQASTAMYQLSQALASGTVKLMDWNSVVNAGMGGQVFQDALKETARVHGVAIDDMIKKNGSFRETLQEGWLTSEILTETLMKFTMTTEGLTEAQIEQNRAMLKSKGYTDEQIDGIFKLGKNATDAATKVKTFTQLMDTLKEAAQSGWTQTWELLVGDFGEAKELFTYLSDTFSEIIGNSADSRNKMLGGALTSSWDKLITKVNEAGVSTEKFEETAKSALTEHGYNAEELIKKYGSLEEVFRSGAAKSEVLNTVIGKLNGTVDKNGKTLKKAAEYTVKEGDNLWSIAKKYNLTWYDIYKLNKDIIKDPELIFPGQVLKIGTEAMEEATAATGKQIESYEDLIDTIQQTGGRELLVESFKNVLESLIKTCGTVRSAWKSVFPPMTSDQLYSIIEGIHSFSERLKLSKTDLYKLSRTFKGLFSILSIAGTIIGGPLSVGFKIFREILKSFDMDLLDVTSAIGKAIIKFDTWLKSVTDFSAVFDKIAPKIQEAVKAIKDWYKGLKEADDPFTYIAESIGAGLANLVLKIKGFFSSGMLENGEAFVSGFLVGIQNGVSSIIGAVVNFATTVLSKFREVLGIHSPSTETASDGENFVLGFINGIKAIASTAWTSIKNFGKKCIEVFSNIDWGAIFAVGVLGVTIYGIVKIFKLLDSVTEPLGGIGEGIEKVTKSLSTSLRAQAVKTIAESIGILAGALIALSLVPTEKLIPAVVAMAATAVILISSVALLGKTSALKDDSIKNIAKLSLGIIGISASLVIFAIAAKKLGSVEPEALVKTFGVLVSLFASIALMCRATDGMSKDFVGFGKMMLALGGALLIMSAVIAIFGHMKTETLLRGGVSILGCMALLAAFVGAIALIQKKTNQSQLIKFGGMMFALGGSLLIMSAAIAIFGHMEWRTLGKGIVGVISCMALLAAFVGAIALIQKKTNQSQLIKFGGMMLALSSSLMIFAATISIFGHMDSNVLEQGIYATLGCMAALALFVLAIAGISKITNEGEIAKFGLVMLALGGALLLMSVSVIALGILDPETLTKGLKAVGVLSALLAALLFCSQFAQGVKMGPIIAMTVAIGVLAISVASLSLIDGSKLASAAIALGSLIGMFALLTFSTKFINAKSLISIGVMTLAVGALAYMLHSLSDIQPANALGVSVALSVLLASLSASLLILAGVGATGPAALIGVGILALLIAVIGGTIAIGIASLPAVGKKLSEFMGELQPFLDGLGKFDANAISGIKSLAEVFFILSASSIFDKLTGGKSLSNFGSQLKPFAEGIAEFSAVVTSKNFDAAAITNAATAAEALVGLANKVPSTGGLKQLITGSKDLGDFGSDLSIFGSSLSAFSDSVTGKSFDATAITNAATAADALITATDGIPESGGLKQLINGTKDLGAYSTDLGSFGLALAAFNTAVTGKNFDTTAIKSAAEAAKELITTTDGIPESGGLKQLINGTKDLGAYSTDLGSFGLALAAFNTAVTGKTFDATAIKNAAEAAKELITATDGIPETGGLKQLITGTKGLDDYSTDLGTFGLALAAFNSAVTDKTFNSSKVKSAAEAAKELITATNGIPSSDGLAQLITGTKGLDDYSTDLGTFGLALAAFNSAVTDKTFNSSKVKSAAEAAKELITATSGIPSTGGLAQLITGTKGLGDYSTDLGTFGLALAAFNTAVTDKTFNDSKVKSAAEAAKELITATNGIPATGGLAQLITGTKGLGDYSTDLGTFGLALAAFNTAVTDETFNSSKVKSAAEAAKELITATSGIQATGGLKQLLTGVADIEGFGTQLGALGSGLASFNKSVSGDNAIDPDLITPAISAVESLAGIATTVGDNSAGWDWLTGKDSLSDFGTNLEQLGGGLSKFSAKVAGKDFSISSVTSAVTEIEKFVGMAERMQSEEFEGLTMLGNSLESLGVSTQLFYNGIADVDASKFSNVASGLESLASINTTNADAVQSFITSLGTVSADGIDKFAESFSNCSQEILTAVSSFFTTTAGAILSNSSKISIAMMTVVGEAIRKIMSETVYMAFYGAGGYLVDGFATGISANTYKAEAKAAAMAQAAEEAAKAELDINSPSKVFRRIGKSVPEGFAQGIGMLKSLVTRSSTTMADSAIGSTKRALSRIADVVNGDLDAQPTIRPVLDLSNIQAGTSAINGMLAMNPSIGAVANIRAISSRMLNRQNGVNDDVISAIKDLGRTIGDRPTNTYNVNGISYDDGSAMSTAVRDIVRAARVERRK